MGIARGNFIEHDHSSRNGSEQEGPLFQKMGLTYHDSTRCPSHGKARRLLANNFYQCTLPPSTVKLTIENLFPRTKIQFAFRDRHHDFPSHDLPFEMRIRIVFSRPVVPIL
jgi:hypothetical protein